MAQIKKVHISNEQLPFIQSRQLVLDMNYIVPDNKPRISSVINTDVCVVATSVNIDNDIIELNISADCSILYNALSVSEEEEHFFTTACNFSKDFKESFVPEGLTDNAAIETRSLIVNVNCNNVETMLISDRKVMVKAYVTLDTVLRETLGIDTAEEFEDKNIVSRKIKHECMRSLGVMRVQSFIKEDVKSENEIPSVDTVLYRTASIQIDNKKITQGKAVFYGTAHIDVMYSNMEATPHFYCVGFDVNFNQACELPEVSDDAVIDVRGKVSELSVDAKENGVFGIEMLIGFEVEVTDKFIYNVIEDAFLPGEIFDVTKMHIKGCNTVQINESVGVCSEKIVAGEIQIANVLMACVNAKDVQAYMKDSRMYFEGAYFINVFYIPKSDENTVCCIHSEVPFSYMFDVSNYGTMISSCAVNIKSITASLNDFGEIAVKWVSDASAKVTECYEYDVVISAENNGNDIEFDRAVFYHYIDGDETAWDIAKRFGVSPDTLCKMNCVDTEEELVKMHGIMVIRNL